MEKIEQKESADIEITTIFDGIVRLFQREHGRGDIIFIERTSIPALIEVLKREVNHA